METLNATQSDTTGDNPDKCQVNDKTDKTPKARRVRSGEGTVAYWKARLFRNSYTDREGRKIQIPEYYIRMRRDGVTKRVKLHSSDKEEAALQALNLSEQLRSNGWSAITAVQSRLPASPTIEQFIEAYVMATASMEDVPRPITIHLYTRCLRQLCAIGGIKNIRDLTPLAIEKARDAYRAKARTQKRPESAIRNTLTTITRNAAACFSREARAIMQRNGLG